MKVLLLDTYIQNAKYRICKDTNGSYGTANDYGDSIFPKILSKIAKKTNFWPPIYLMYVGSVLRNQGHEIYYLNNIENEDEYDCIIMSSSIVCHESELNEIKKIKDKSKIIVVGSFATNTPKNYLDLGVNIIFGEPEFYFLKNGLSKILENKNMGEKWESFGWLVSEIDGHNFQEIIDSFNKIGQSEKPLLILAKTVKGKGVKMFENNNAWHHSILTQKFYDEAIKELDNDS